jgi:hypothetical protein
MARARVVAELAPDLRRAQAVVVLGIATRAVGGGLLRARPDGGHRTDDQETLLHRATSSIHAGHAGRRLESTGENLRTAAAENPGEDLRFW